MKRVLQGVLPLVAASFIFTAGCTPTDFTVGGKVSGISSTLGLSLNGTESLFITKKGTYKFASHLVTGSPYNVTVTSQPDGQNCTVANGSGTIASVNISNVNVTCEALPQFHVGGTVTGLEGNLALVLNGGDPLALSADGTFQFAALVNSGESYSVAISAQPTGQDCNISDGSGTMSNSDVSNVAINCVTTALPPVITNIWPSSILGGYEIKISGSNLDLANIVYNGAAITPTLQTPNELHFVAPEYPKDSYVLELKNIAGYTSQNVTQGQLMTGIVAMSSSGLRSCAVLQSGSVQCWGRNTGSNPVMVSGISAAVAISNNCALLQSGSVQCWSASSDGQPITTVSGISTAVAISNNCAVLQSGSVQCWSPTSDGQPITTVSGISTVVMVAADSDHSCAVLQNGTVQCWGSNYYGQLGNGTTTDSATPVTVSGISSAVAVAVAAGGARTCAVLSDHSVKCWGRTVDDRQQSGYNSMFVTSPVTVSGISSAIAVTAGEDFSCALLDSGTAICWGANYSGELGYGTTAQSSMPVTVSGIGAAVTVAAGTYHDCAVLQNGGVQCWGRNSFGQLGYGSFDPTAVPNPVSVSGVSTATAVVAGYKHSCALLQSGSVQCWGDNDGGMLGNHSSLASPLPVTVSGISKAVEVGKGIVFSCAALADGSVQCWGQGSFFDSHIPVTVAGISTAVAVSGSCALLESGSVQCWFSNTSNTAVAVSGISTAVTISNNCAVLQSGSIQCWNSSSDGQPLTTVSGISTAVMVAADSDHSCAVLQNGTVQCWGSNYYGQLGNGTTTDSATPVTVSGINNAVIVSVGGFHSCAVLQNGSVQCWGDNEYGELAMPMARTNNQPVLPVYFQ